MKYAVDKVEDDIVLLENILNGEKITVQKECFSFPIKETDIVIKKDGAYLKDDKEKEDRIKIIDIFIPFFSFISIYPIL